MKAIEIARTKEQQGVQSVEIGMALLVALAALPRPVGLSELAEAAGMAPAKAHRYLVSLIRAGMVEQSGESGKYRLGETALHIGLAALSGLDVMGFAGETLAALHDRVDETLLLAVWGNRGPVVVRWEEGTRPITTNLRPGSVMPLLNSSTGRAFAAFLPETLTRPYIAEESGRDPTLAEGFANALAETRSHGLARVLGDLLPGIAALSVPVFDHQDEVAAVISALGRQDRFDVRWEGTVAIELRRAAGDLSHRLGHGGAAT